MRAALAIAALATGALAVPYKRDWVTEVKMVYVTDTVTVTAGQPMPSAVNQAPPAAVSVQSAVVQVQPSPQPKPVFQAPPAAAPSVPSVPNFGPATTYQQLVVDHHNMHRRNHSAPDVQWDEGLAASAATIAASCVYAHNTGVDGGGYGQNIAAGVAANNVSAVITDLFYNGEEPYFASLYGQANPSMQYFENWGHFSQIVWKSTTSVGCATQYCPNGLGNVGSGVQPYFTVCNYKGPGNYAGEYAANVLAPLGMPTINWNTGM